jgi:hypothetical protein
MKKLLLLISFHFTLFAVNAQGPAVTAWLQNTTVKGSYYTTGNSTAQTNNILANCQKVEYSTSWVYVSTKGIPSFPTGPFAGNPTIAQDQNAIFKISRTPVQNTGTPTATAGGNIGIFINGTALFDFGDAVSWENASGSYKGGPIGGTGDKKWNRDAVVAERGGFDCSKAHPANGNYHHHQNPSAFKLDKTVLSTICNLYDADGLYRIDTTKHSPLIGFAYDGFPIYGAYGYQNPTSGAIVRIKSGYQMRSITVRTHWADGTDVLDGPAVNATYPLGTFREDFEYIAHPTDSSYLDVSNGRFCKTPEYPNGIYCYFATVDANWNSAYPYVVGPTYYGIKNAQKVTTIGETTTVYTVPNAAVSISASATTICAGTSVTFTATPTNGGTTPIYQWKKNGTNVGTNSATYSDNAITNGNVITCDMTTSTPTTVSSNSITMTVSSSVTPSISITTPSTTICAGETAIFTATPTNGGTAPTYQWKKNGTNVGTNSATYSDNAITNGNTITCVLTSNLSCATTPNATSNTIAMVISASVTPAVTISSPSTSITSGTNIVFTAIPGNGGSAPSYQWKKNGTNVGTNSNTYSESTLANGDVISCIMTSNSTCAIPKTATSNNLTMTVISGGASISVSKDLNSITVYKHPYSELIIVQVNDLLRENLNLELYDMTGKLIAKSQVYQGSTMGYFDTQRLYNGIYLVRIQDNSGFTTKKIEIRR